MHLRSSVCNACWAPFCKKKKKLRSRSNLWNIKQCKTFNTAKKKDNINLKKRERCRITVNNFVNSLFRHFYHTSVYFTIRFSFTSMLEIIAKLGQTQYWCSFDVFSNCFSHIFHCLLFNLGSNVAFENSNKNTLKNCYVLVYKWPESAENYSISVEKAFYFTFPISFSFNVTSGYMSFTIWQLWSLVIFSVSSASV